MKTIIRWVLVVPVFLSSLMLANFLIALLNFREPAVIVSLFNSVVSTAVGIGCGVWVAPSARHYVGVALAVIVIALEVFLLFAARYTTADLVGYVLGAISAIWCAVMIWTKKNEISP